MWTRRELKDRAKEALKKNYWRAVLVSLLFALVGGGIGIGTGSSAGVSSSLVAVDAEPEDGDTTYTDELRENGKSLDELDEGGIIVGQFLPEENVVSNTIPGFASYEAEWAGLDELDSTEFVIAITIAVIIFLIVFIVILLVAVAIDVFLLNPIDMGVHRFMLKDLDESAEVKEVVYGFDHCYKNVVKVMFRRDLSIFLWALLFVIPGVYKKYQYRMVPYILSERPDMDYREALDLSREMMDGEKWRAFVLDLSFILWHILGTITCGMVEIFYVAPYRNLTNAALYQKLTAARNENTGVIDMA